MVDTVSSAPRTAAEHRIWWEQSTSVPYGYCWCGCGERTRLAPQSITKLGWVNGEPVRYLPNHHLKTGKRKPRKLGGAKDADICRRYEAGEGILKISAEFGINKATVHRVLKRAGIAPNRRLSGTDTYAIRRRYESGEAGGNIAKEFGVSKEAIYRVLDKFGVVRRPWHGPPPTLGPGQVDEAAKRYTAGDTCKAIAQHFGVSATCVLETLRRNGVQIRRRGTLIGGTRPYLWVLPPEEHPKICSRYRECVSCEALARKYEVSASVISDILKRNGIEMRPGVASEPLSPSKKRMCADDIWQANDLKRLVKLRALDLAPSPSCWRVTTCSHATRSVTRRSKNRKPTKDTRLAIRSRTSVALWASRPEGFTKSFVAAARILRGSLAAWSGKKRKRPR